MEKFAYEIVLFIFKFFWNLIILPIKLPWLIWMYITAFFGNRKSMHYFTYKKLSKTQPHEEEEDYLGMAEKAINDSVKTISKTANDIFKNLPKI